MNWKEVCAIAIVLAAVVGAFYIDQLDSGSCFWIAILLYFLSRDIGEGSILVLAA